MSESAMPSRQTDTPGALLTDNAVAAVESQQQTWSADGLRHRALEPFVRYHATEGRDALVERVARVLHGSNRLTEWDEALPRVQRAYWKDAEAVVADLFGGRA